MISSKPTTQPPKPRRLWITQATAGLVAMAVLWSGLAYVIRPVGWRFVLAAVFQSIVFVVASLIFSRIFSSTRRIEANNPSKGD